MSRPVNGGDFSAGCDGRVDFARYDLYDTEQRVRLNPITHFDARYFGGGVFPRWRTLVGEHVALDLGLRADGVYYRSLNRLAGASWTGDGDIL